jgi:hypothetical protein
MKTKPSKITEQLTAFQDERQQLAYLLQNDVNQILASALLCLQFGKTNNLNEESFFNQAESNLKLAIGKVSPLHYSLSKEVA